MDEKALRALAIALEAEQESLRDYLRFAWQTRDPGGKNMFIRLASDEFEHLRLLESQEAELQRCGQWRPVDLPPNALEKLVPRLSERDRRIRGDAGQTDLAALNTALDAEQRAARFYAEQSAAGAAPAMYRRLAEMEQAHAQLIQAEIDSITGTGFWFGLPEFSLETEVT